MCCKAVLETQQSDVTETVIDFVASKQLRVSTHWRCSYKIVWKHFYQGDLLRWPNCRYPLVTQSTETLPKTSVRYAFGRSVHIKPQDSSIRGTHLEKGIPLADLEPGSSCCDHQMLPLPGLEHFWMSARSSCETAPAFRTLLHCVRGDHQNLLDPFRVQGTHGSVQRPKARETSTHHSF